MTRLYNPYATNIQQYINEAIKNALKRFQTCIPAIVKTVKSREQVVVSPAIQLTDASWKTIPWADIQLPVYTPAGGAGLMSFPLSPGDTGWIIAGDLDPTLFYQDPTKPARQGVFDRHNYQYGFFLPCKMKNYGIDSSDDGGIVIKTSDAKIVIKDNEITVEGGNELKVNAKTVKITSNGNNVTIDGVNFKNHTHSGSTLTTTATVGSSATPGTISGNTGGVN